MFEYAPVVIFAYNRADRLFELLQCLKKNKCIEKMDLFIFVDIPDTRNKKDLRYNAEVLDLLNDYKGYNWGFKRSTIEIARQHKGLAKSVITGVSKVINVYGKVIVLEDDLIVSNDFLDYMQRGLCFYKDDKKVWSVAAHCPKVKELSKYEKDIFLAPRIESIGWGTWIDRWNKTDWDVKTYERFKKDVIGQLLFSIGGNDLCRMLKTQMMDKKLDSWAIRWCYQEFLERKYTVFPRESRVVHCGNDKRSTHGAYYSTQKLKSRYKRCTFETIKPNMKIIWGFRKVNSIPFKQRLMEIWKNRGIL